MAVSIQHPLFKRIQDEHLRIDLLVQSCVENQISKDSLEQLYKFAESEHHYNEEELLFKIVGQDPRLVNGGPMCMFYMDDYIMNHPVENLTLQTGLNIEIPQRLASFYETGSNLRIPLNEHLVGAKVLAHLIAQYDSLSPLQKEKLFNLYRQIHSNNKSKEENCFLLLCSTLLSEEQADEILNNWNKHEL